MTLHRWFLWIVLPVVLLLLAGATAAWWHSETQWEETLVQVAAHQQEFDKRRGIRPVLWGDSVEGRAFDDYWVSTERATKRAPEPSAKATAETGASSEPLGVEGERVPWREVGEY